MLLAGEPLVSCIAEGCCSVCRAAPESRRCSLIGIELLRAGLLAAIVLEEEALFPDGDRRCCGIDMDLAGGFAMTEAAPICMSACANGLDGTRGLVWPRKQILAVFSSTSHHRPAQPLIHVGISD